MESDDSIRDFYFGMGRTGGFVRRNWPGRSWVIAGASFLLVLGFVLSADRASAATVTNISWESQDSYNRFVMQFDELPKYNAVDSLAQSKLFYVDFYGLKQTYKTRLLQVDDKTLKYVHAMSYTDQGVLRLVFYVKEGAARYNIQTLANPPRVVIDTIQGQAQPTPAEQANPGAGKATGSAELSVSALPAQTPAVTAPGASTPGPTGGAAVPSIPEPRLRPREASSGSRKIVVIDPGHGGANNGAKSRVQVGGQTVLEKELTFQFALALKKVIDSSSNMVALVTRVDDSNVALGRRVDMAEEYEGDLFVSLHINDADNTGARGMEVFYLDQKGTTDAAVRALEEKENKEVGLDDKVAANTIVKGLLTDLQKANLKTWQFESYVFCKHIIQSMVAHPFYAQNNRGIKSANFVVLRNFSMPAVLFEIGFISNSEDLQFLVNPQFQHLTAILLSNSINSYFAENDPNFKPRTLSLSSRGTR